MSLEYFEGPAGSGKTYQLVETLKLMLAKQNLSEDEAVLGLTYMHGSRRRMHDRLAAIPILKGRFLACTIDSLARRVIFRWRTIARAADPEMDLTASVDFARVCRIASLIVSRPTVAIWLKVRYPIVVVDELQDCKGSHLSIVRALESHCHVIAAADEFQDLQCTGANEAVEWLRGSAGKQNVLSGNCRTDKAELLHAAGRLRSGEDCGDVLGKALLFALNADVGAGHVARTICWKGTKDLVILTPTGPDKSQFVRNVVKRLTSKPIQPKGIPKSVGPFRIVWESNVDGEKATVFERLGSAVELEEIRHICSGESGALGDLLEWVERKYRIKGQTCFSKIELEIAVERVLQSRRAFLPSSFSSQIRAMTINQAKNREFEGVVVLWPFEVSGNVESLRRRLYNALTRAKKWAVVIVQDSPSRRSRLTVPPFSKRTSSE